MKSNDSVKVLTVRGTSFEPAAVAGGSAATDAAPTDGASNTISEWVGQELSKSDRPELAGANIVISGGKYRNLIWIK